MSTEASKTSNIIGIILALPVVAWTLYVAQTTWLWILVPAGLPELTLAQIVGLSLVLGVLNIDTKKGAEDKYTLLEKMLIHFFAGLFTLGIAAILAWVVQ
jgi:hypothetical protein